MKNIIFYTSKKGPSGAALVYSRGVFFLKVMLKKFSLSLVEQQRRKRNHKSTIPYMSWEQCLRGDNFRKDAQYQKIIIVIIWSKAISFIKDRLKRVTSFRFLVI